MVVLLEGSPVSTYELWTSASDHLVLGHLPDQGPSAPTAQFGRRPAIGRVVELPNFFNLRMMEANVFIGTFNAAEMFWHPSPDLCLETILSQNSTDNSFNLMAWFPL
jgi:hypothetical protein